MDDLRKPWLESEVQKSLDLFHGIRRSTHQGKSSDHIGKNGELAIQSRKRKHLQILKWIPHNNALNTEEKSESAWAQLSDKYVQLQAEFTPECVGNYEAETGSSLTTRTGCGIIALWEYEIVFKGSDGKLFFKNITFDQQRKASKEQGKKGNTEGESENPKDFGPQSTPEVILRIHKFEMKTTDAFKLGNPAPLNDKFRQKLKNLPRITANQKQTRPQKKQEMLEKAQSEERKLQAKVNDKKDVRLPAIKKPKSKRMLDDDDLDDDAISQIPVMKQKSKQLLVDNGLDDEDISQIAFATQIMPPSTKPWISTATSEDVQTPALGWDRKSGKGRRHSPKSPRSSSSSENESTEGKSGPRRKFSGQYSQIVPHMAQHFYVEVEKRKPDDSSGIDEPGESERIGLPTPHFDRSKEAHAIGLSPPSHGLYLHPGWEGMTEVTDADVAIPKDQKVKLESKTSWFKKEMMSLYNNGTTIAAQKTPAADQEYDGVYDLPAPPQPLIPHSVQPITVSNLGSSQSEEEIPWSSSQISENDMIDRNVMPPDSSAYDIPEPLNPPSARQVSPYISEIEEDRESSCPSKSTIDLPQTVAEEPDGKSPPHSPLIGQDDGHDSDETPRRPLRKQGQSPQSQTPTRSSPSTTQTNRAMNRLRRATNVNQTESEESKSSEEESDAEAALMVNPTGMTNVAKYGILRSQKLVIKKKEKDRRKERLSRGLPAESEDEYKISDPEPYVGYSSSDEKEGRRGLELQRGTRVASDSNPVVASPICKTMPIPHITDTQTIEKNLRSSLTGDPERGPAELPVSASESVKASEGFVIEIHHPNSPVHLKGKVAEDPSNSVNGHYSTTFTQRHTRSEGRNDTDSDSDDEIPQAQPRPYKISRIGPNNIATARQGKQPTGAEKEKVARNLTNNAPLTNRNHSPQAVVGIASNGQPDEKAALLEVQKKPPSKLSVTDTYPSTNPLQKNPIVQVADTPQALLKATGISEKKKIGHTKRGQDGSTYVSEDEEVIPATAFSPHVEKPLNKGESEQSKHNLLNYRHDESGISDQATLEIPLKTPPIYQDLERKKEQRKEQSVFVKGRHPRANFAVVIPARPTLKRKHIVDDPVGSPKAGRKRTHVKKLDFGSQLAEFKDVTEIAKEHKRAYIESLSASENGSTTTNSGNESGINVSRQALPADSGISKPQPKPVTLAREITPPRVPPQETSEHIHHALSKMKAGHQTSPGVANRARPPVNTLTNKHKPSPPPISPRKNIFPRSSAAPMSSRQSPGTISATQRILNAILEKEGIKNGRVYDDLVNGKPRYSFPGASVKSGTTPSSSSRRSSTASGVSKPSRPFRMAGGLRSTDSGSFTSSAAQSTTSSASTSRYPLAANAMDTDSPQIPSFSQDSSAQRDPRERERWMSISSDEGNSTENDKGSSNKGHPPPTSRTPPAATFQRPSLPPHRARQKLASQGEGLLQPPPVPTSSNGDSTEDGSANDVIPAVQVHVPEKVQRTLIPQDRFTELLQREKPEKVPDYSGVKGKEIEILIPGYNSLSSTRKQQLGELRRAYFGPEEVGVKDVEEREAEEEEEEERAEEEQRRKKMSKGRLEEVEWWKDEVTPMKKFVKGLVGMKLSRKEMETNVAEGAEVVDLSTARGSRRGGARGGPKKR